MDFLFIKIKPPFWPYDHSFSPNL